MINRLLLIDNGWNELLWKSLRMRSSVRGKVVMATAAAAAKALPFPTAIFLLVHLATTVAASSVGHEIRRGFWAAHDPSYSQFQPLLADPTGVFSLGFLRAAASDSDSSQLDLAVLHLASTTALWRAALARPLLWAAPVSLSFNGSLVLSDAETGILWLTPAVDAGDRLVLLNSSNLQVQKLAAGTAVVVLWESFDFPSDTLVQGQNFIAAAVVKSTDQIFSLRVEESYLALYMELPGGTPPVMYWRHAAMQAKAQIVAGGGAIYAQVGDGFLGMYQNESAPVDVLPFDSFNLGIRGFRRLTLESDGNLRAYYWNGTIWAKDLEAIPDRCDIPTSCGAYGLCDDSGGCGCLDGTRKAERCLPAASGDFCAAGANEFGILRRKGVDLANKLLAAHEKVGSLEECEAACERNCSCWGAIYNNASGYCYRLDYPIQSLVAADEMREGYFKVRSSGGGGGGRRRRVKVALLAVGSLVLVGTTIAAVVAYCVRRRRRGVTSRVEGSMVEGLTPGPYKGLKSASFRSVELS